MISHAITLQMRSYQHIYMKQERSVMLPCPVCLVVFLHISIWGVFLGVLLCVHGGKKQIMLCVKDFPIYNF